VLNYDEIEDLHDGRGYTAGRAEFITSSTLSAVSQRASEAATRRTFAKNNSSEGWQTLINVSPMAKGVKTKPPGTLWTGPSADGPFVRRAGGGTSRELSAVTLTVHATCGVAVPRG
jgi:hypothetical protein